VWNRGIEEAIDVGNIFCFAAPFCWKKFWVRCSFLLFGGFVSGTETLLKKAYVDCEIHF
jgi:hypothetical protein